MSRSLIVRGARQLITLHGAGEPRRGPALQELGIIRDGALLIREGRIAEVGLSRRVENLAGAHECDEIDATGRVVMPGFVDCHTHLIWDEPDWDARDGAAAGAAGATRDPQGVPGALRNASARRLESRTRQFIHGMVRHGTTMVGAKSGYGLEHRDELKILRVYAKLNQTPLDITSTFLISEMLPALQDGQGELLAAICRRELARFVGIRHHERISSAEHCHSYLQAARNLGFLLKVHASHGSARDAIQLAVRAGATSIDHLHDGAPEDVELLANSNTIAVLLPGSAFRNGNGLCAPARGLIDAGVAVALGTNFNPRTSPSYSMQTMIALACVHLGMSPAEAISASTINAAWALGAGHSTGSLETGKRADLIVLNVSDYREIPHNFGVNLVHTTVKRGLTIYQEGNVTK